MSNTCQVEIENTTYYVPCDRVEDLYFTGQYLVNMSSSSITMKSIFNTNSEYPYISCSSMSICRLRDGSSNYHYITSNYNLLSDPFLTFNYLPLIFIVLFITLGVRLVWKR